MSTIETVLEYKCPSCAGKIVFDANLQKMKCPFCDSEFDIDTLKAFNDKPKDEINWDINSKNDGATINDGDADGIKTYICNSCGGEIIGDATLAASSCPFCNNPVVIKEQFEGILKPDLIIPFKLDKNAAKAALLSHYKGKKLVPKAFKTENHIDEIKGVYVPFWLFDCDVDANVNYKCNKIRVWSDSNYNYTETSTFLATRKGQVGFDHVPVDGSTKMADDLMESIEPFDWSDGVDFETAYLSGFLADKYDVDAESSIPRANERIRNSTEETFRSTVVGYDSVVTQNSTIHIDNGACRYALLPIWLLNSSWKDKKYSFAMNAQTGKFVGDLPVDRKLWWKWFAIYSGIFSVASMAILFLLSYFL